MSTSRDKLEFIIPELLNKGKVRAYFTLANKQLQHERTAVRGLNLGFNTADSKQQVQANRNLVLQTLDISPENIAYAEQVHGSQVQFVTGGGTYPAVDALVTATPGLALGIQVADCAVLLLADREAGIIAAVHAGWRGAAGNIVHNALDVMIEKGASPEAIQAFISPSISKENFEVGPEVAEHFPEAYVDRHTRPKPHVDLKAFLKHQLKQRRIAEHNIQKQNGCTFNDENRFYSYRREGGQSGRMMGLIQLKEL